MKTHSFAISLILGVATAMLSSCDAMWGVDLDSEYPVSSYSYSLGGEWRPSLPAAPLISPVYWGNSIYPGPAIPPAAHWQQVRPNSPSGNVRPPQATPTLPSGNVRPGSTTSGETIALPSHPINATGGQPGIALPPAGTGYTPTQGRH